MMMNAFHIRFANRLGIFLALLFAVCFAWFAIRPVAQDLHLQLFRMAYLGFEEMNLTAFIWGAAQSYLWAYVGVALWQVAALITRKGKSAA